MRDNDSKNKEIHEDARTAAAYLSGLLHRDGFTTPDLLVQQINLTARTAIVLRMTRRAYRAASFLDSRVLPFARDGFALPHAHLLRWTEAIVDTPRPIHFIFHTGHVGSTLISRLVDEADGVLSLREPPTLRTLAHAHDMLGQEDAPLSPSEYDAWFATQLRLWRRGYDDTRCVVVKTTSDTARIGHRLMNDAPTARAILLNVPAETYLAQTLSALSVRDVHDKLPERLARLARLLGDVEEPRSTGEAIASSWLAEQLTHDRIRHPWPERILRVDFDAFLADSGVHLAAIFKHLQLEAPDTLRDSRAAGHPLMSQYSKQPDRGFSASDRAERLTTSRCQNATEIRSGLSWLERTARAHPHAAAALAA